MTNYVAGFLFSKDRNSVLLIRKRRPAWMLNQLNGIGGKIEDGESSLDAMIREFKEETGLTITDWSPTVTLCGTSWAVQFYRSESDDIDNALTMTDETVVKVAVSTVSDLYAAVPHLKWLVPMLQQNIVHWPLIVMENP